MRSITTRTLGIIAALSLVLSACGDDDDIDTGAAGDVDTADVEEAQDDLTSTLDDLGLSSLSSAVAQVDLSELVDSDEYTFFAPNDEAFTSLSGDELADLLADPELLADILRNHLIEEQIDADALAGMDSVTTAFGETLDVAAAGESITVGGATVVDADRTAGSATIHVIDGLLVPA